MAAKSNNVFKISLLAAAVAIALTACGGGGSAATSTSSAPTLGTVTATAGTTVISQTVSVVDTDGNTPPKLGNQAFPRQANHWDIAGDFSLEDGFDDQFDNALQPSISVDGGSSYASFPSDQTKSELTWYTPLVGTADGLKGVAVADATFAAPAGGLKSAYIEPATADTRLQQTLNLTGATGSVTLTWAGYQPSVNLPYITQATDSVFQVVLRDAGGALLTTLYSRGTSSTVGNWGSADISAYAGQTVVLSFEYAGDGYPYAHVEAQIDNVSVVDGGSVQYVSNGDFETDLTGWTTNVTTTSTNFTSGVRTVSGLDVQRSFYTVPNKLWGRWVDVYKNTTGAPITATIRYMSNLGSDGSGIVYSTPGTSNKALTSWDGSASDRDVGMVFGNASTFGFTSAPSTSASGTVANPSVFPDLTLGNDDIYMTYNVTVPANGQVTIVNFIVMDGTDTGSLGTTVDATAQATEIDTAAAAIVANFRTDPQYRNGMTQAQIDSIVNF